MIAKRASMLVVLFVFTAFSLFLTISADADTTELIKNGNFESATSSDWSMGMYWNNTNLNPGHDGSRYAYFGSGGAGVNNSDSAMDQSFNVPADVQSLSVTFWYRITTAETTVTATNDTLDVTLVRENPVNLDVSIGKFSNLNKSVPTTTWLQKSFVISNATAYAGEALKLSFYAKNNSTLPTIFRIDSVSVLATLQPALTASITNATVTDVSGNSNSFYRGANCLISYTVSASRAGTVLLGASARNTATDVTYDFSAPSTDTTQQVQQSPPNNTLKLTGLLASGAPSGTYKLVLSLRTKNGSSYLFPVTEFDRTFTLLNNPPSYSIEEAFVDGDDLVLKARCYDGDEGDSLSAAARFGPDAALDNSQFVQFYTPLQANIASGQLTEFRMSNLARINSIGNPGSGSTFTRPVGNASLPSQFLQESKAIYCRLALTDNRGGLAPNSILAFQYNRPILASISPNEYSTIDVDIAPTAKGSNLTTQMEINAAPGFTSFVPAIFSTSPTKINYFAKHTGSVGQYPVTLKTAPNGTVLSTPQDLVLKIVAPNLLSNTAAKIDSVTGNLTVTFDVNDPLSRTLAADCYLSDTNFNFSNTPNTTIAVTTGTARTITYSPSTLADLFTESPTNPNRGTGGYKAKIVLRSNATTQVADPALAEFSYTYPTITDIQHRYCYLNEQSTFAVLGYGLYPGMDFSIGGTSLTEDTTDATPEARFFTYTFSSALFPATDYTAAVFTAKATPRRQLAMPGSGIKIELRPPRPTQITTLGFDAGGINNQLVGGDFVLPGQIQDTGSPPIQRLILEVNNVPRAECLVSRTSTGGVQTFSPFQGYWKNPFTGAPITLWEQVLGTSSTLKRCQLYAERTNGAFSVSTFKVGYQSNLTNAVAFAAADKFPVILPMLDSKVVTANSNEISATSVPVTRRWMRADRAGLPANDGLGTGVSQAFRLGYDNDGITTTDDFRFTGCVVIALESSDATHGYKTYSKRVIPVGVPCYTGDPAESSSGSQLINGMDLATSNYHRFEEDLSLPSYGASFATTRAYNSNAELISGYSAWTWSFDQKIIIPRSSSSRVVEVQRDDGRRQLYVLQDDGVWHSANPGNDSDQLQDVGDGTFKLYSKQGETYYFGPCQATATGDVSCLERVETPHHQGYAIARLNDGRVNTVTDAGGRVFRCGYNNAHQLTRVTLEMPTPTQSGLHDLVVQYTYNAQGRLETVTDPKGNITTYTYDASSSNRMVRVKLPENNSPVQALNYTFANRSMTDGEGNVTTIAIDPQDSSKRIVTYGANAPDEPGKRLVLKFSLSPEGSVQSITDANGKVASVPSFVGAVDDKHISQANKPQQVRDEKGRITTLGYSADDKGNLASITDAELKETQIDGALFPADQKNLYRPGDIRLPKADANNRAVSATKAGGAKDFRVIHNVYFPTGDLTEMTDALNRKTTFTYDNPNWPGLADTMTDPKGNLTRYTYDRFGEVAQTIYPDNLGYTETSRDDRGFTTSVRDRRGKFTYFEFDDNGNLTRTTAPPTPGPGGGGTQTHIVNRFYDKNDRLTKVVDAKGQAVEYTYDNNNRVKTVFQTVDGLLRRTLYDYDAVGRMFRRTIENSPTSYVTTHGYDSTGRPTSSDYGLGSSTRQTYTETGKVAISSNGEGQALTYEYDSLDRVKKVTDALGNFVEYIYDYEGNLWKFRDQREFFTEYIHDAGGQLTKVIDAEGGVTEATYDLNGNLETLKNANQHTVTFAYDALNRRRKLTTAAGNIWQFDFYESTTENRFLRTLPGGLGHVETFFDDLGRPYQENRHVIGAADEQITYEYDANGNRTRMTDSISTSSYAYNEADEMTVYTDPFGKQLFYGHNQAGQITKRTYPENHDVTYGFDAASRLETVNVWTGVTFRYSYNKADQVTSLLHPSGVETKNVYDDAGRLKVQSTAQSSGEFISKHTLTLDAAGNSTKAEMKLPQAPSLPDPKEIQHGLDEAVTSVLVVAAQANASAPSTPQYDDAGRMTGETTGATIRAYAFNAIDRITSVTVNGLQTQNFRYNGDGVRLEKTATNGNTSNTTRYLVDPNRSLPSAVADMDSAGNIERYYIHGLGLLAQVDANSGELLSYHSDPAGNVLALSDGSQAIRHSYRYDEHGKSYASSSFSNRFRMSGEWSVGDDGDGLVDMRAREYNTRTSSFMSRDPVFGSLRDPQTFNPYSYGRGNPGRYADPSGQFWQLVDRAIKRARSGVVRLTSFGSKVRGFIKGEFSKITKAITDPVISKTIDNVSEVVSASTAAIEEFSSKKLPIIGRALFLTEVVVVASLLHDEQYEKAKSKTYKSAIVHGSEIACSSVGSPAFGYYCGFMTGLTYDITEHAIDVFNEDDTHYTSSYGDRVGTIYHMTDLFQIPRH